MNRNKIIKVVIGILILGGLVAGIVYNQNKKRTIFNDTYMNGNSGGNLYNGGYFCEYEGTVYFRNPNDNGALYSMDRNRNDLHKLSDDTVSYINADDNYIYYTRNNASKDTSFSFLNIQTHSLCRINKKGGKALVLDSDPCLYASLIGNYVYYIHYDTKTASTLYRVKIDGSERECVLNSDTIAVSANGQTLYYSGTSENYHVYSIDTSTGSSKECIASNCYQPVFSDGYMYYIDCDNNYSLARMNLTSGEVTTLTRDRVDCYNVYGSSVYYQRNDAQNPALCRIKINDGQTEFEEVLSGNHYNINITSTYVYFMKYGDDTTIYCTPTNGKVNVTLFSPDIEN